MPKKFNRFCGFAYKNLNKSSLLFSATLSPSPSPSPSPLSLPSLSSSYSSSSSSSKLKQSNKFSKLFNLEENYYNQKCYISNSAIRLVQTIDKNNNLDERNQLAKLDYANDVLKLTILLPARRELCEFSLRLLNDTAGSLDEYLRNEDKSIEKVQFFTSDGVRIAKNTSIGSFVTQPFVIKINDVNYSVEPPSSMIKKPESNLDEQSKKDLEEIKQLVSKLYLHLNIKEYEENKEANILKQLEQLKSELEPMEKIREELALKAKKHTNRMIWFGLGLMCVQAGILARLTWFDYSWDIVEPISYFVSYSSVVGVYAYFVLTRKEYDYESATDRIFLRHFHKNAARNNLNVKKYNDLKNLAYSLETDLKRIKQSQLKSLTDSITDQLTQNQHQQPPQPQQPQQKQ